MRQTLFWIPHWAFEGPLLIGWLIVGAIIMACLWWRHGNSHEAWGFLPVYGIVSLVIYFLLPRLEVLGVDPTNPGGDFIPQGLAVRGYGIMLLLAICLGAGISLLRCREAGLQPEQVLNLGFVMMVCGILGARLFFVIQKSEDFFVTGVSLSTLLLNVVDMTKGGLVVYGSLIGGSLGGLVFLKWNRLPIARTADLIAPGMVLGLAIGRIGCLLNGCCFGGVCDAPLPSVTFPAGSPPYIQQLYNGQLLGVIAARGEADQPAAGYSILIAEVAPESLAQRLGLAPGDSISIDAPDDQRIRFVNSRPLKFNEAPAAGQLFGFVYSDRQGTVKFPIRELGARSRLTHPTQIYSAINAALLALVLWSYWRVRKFEGQVFGLMLILYPIGRFVMELIRQDEAGQFGTPFTISQLVSMVMLPIGIAIFFGVRGGGQREPPQAGALRSSTQT